MSHHNRRVKRGEIQRGYRVLIETPSWLDNHSTFVLFSIVTFALNWDHQVVLSGFSVELRCHLDLLSASEEEDNGDTGDSCHLRLIEYAHEFLHEAKRQIGVLEAVNGEASTRKLISILQLCNHTVVHVFLLLTQEVGADGVERVGAQLVLAKDDLHHVKLDSTLNVNVF